MAYALIQHNYTNLIKIKMAKKYMVPVVAKVCLVCGKAKKEHGIINLMGF